eukprot:Em0015g189a
MAEIVRGWMPSDPDLEVLGRRNTGWCTLKPRDHVRRQTAAACLSQEELEIIRRVVARAEVFDRTEEQRLRLLALQCEKVLSSAHGDGSTSCVFCARSFDLGQKYNHVICKDCGKATCISCKADYKQHSGEVICLCKSCLNQRELWMKSGAWFTNTLPTVKEPTLKPPQVLKNQLVRAHDVTMMDELSTKERSQPEPSDVAPPSFDHVLPLGSIHTRKPAGDSTSNEIINAHFTQPSEAKTKTDPGAVSKEDSCHQIQPEVSTILNVADQTPSDSQPPLIEEVHSSIEQTQQVNALPTSNVVDSYEQQTGEDLVTSSKESYDWKCKRGKYVKKGAPKKANVKEGTPGKHNPPVRDTCTSTSALPQVILQQEVLIGDQNETIPAPPTEATSTSTTIPFSSPYRLSQLKPVEGTPAWDGLECVDTQHPLIETVPPHRTLPEVPEVEKAGVEVKNKGTNVEAKIAENEAQLSQCDQGMIGHGQSALSTTSTITDEIPLCVQPLKPDETGASTFESVQQHTTCSEGIVDPHGYRNGEDQDMISKEPYDWKRKRGRYVKRDQRKKTNTGEEALGKPSPPQDANTPQSLPQTPSQQGLIEGQSEIKSVLITELPSMDVASMASREALLIAATTNVSLQIPADSIPTSDMSVEEASKRNGISEAVCDTLPSELSNGEYSVEGQPLASKAGDKDGTVVGLGKAENDRPAKREEVYPHDRIILHPVAVHLPGAKISTNEQGQAEVSITSSITGATPLSTQQCATPPVDATDISKHQTGDLDTTREESFDWRHKRGTHVKKKSQRKKTNDGEEAQEKYHPPPPDTSTTSLPQVLSHQDALISVGSIFQHFVEPTPTAPNETLAKLVCVGLENVETQPPYQQPTSGLSGDVLDRMLSELPSVEKGNTEGKLDVKLSTSENQEVIVVVLGKAECDIPAETVEAHFKQEDILQPVVIHTPDTKTRPHTKDLDVSSEGLKSDKGQTAASISSIVSGLDIQLSKLDGKVVSAIETTQQLITPPEDTVDPHEHQTDTTSKEYFDWKSKRGKYVKKKKTNTGEVVLEKHYKPLQDASTASSQQVPSQQDRTETETIEPTSTNPIETIAESSHPTLELDTAFSISTEPDEEATKHSSIGGGLKCVDTPPPCQQQTSEPNGTIVDGSIIDDRIEAQLEVMSLRDGGGESVAVSLCEPAEAIINAAINGLNVSSLETAFDKKEHPELSINATLPPDIQPSKVEEVFSTIETTQQLIILPEDTVHSQKTEDLDTTREESFDWRRKRGTHVKKKSQRKKTNDGEEVQHHPPPQETNAASLPQVPSHQDALIRVETEILSVEPTHTVPTVIMAELSHATLVQDTALSIQTEPDEEASKHSSIGGGLESLDTPPPCQQPTSDPNGTILDGTQSEISIIEDRIEAKLDNVSLRDVGGESVAISLLSPAEAIISAAMKDLKVSSLETAFDNKEHPELSINAILPPDIQPSKVEEVLSTIETTQHLITLPEDTVHSQTGDLDTTMEESFDWRRKRGTQVKKKSQRKKTNDGEEAQHHPPPQETNAASLPQVPSHQDTLIRVETGILSVEAPHTVPSEIMAELSHPTLELDTALPTEPDEEASKHSSIGGGLESVDTPPSCQLQTSEPSGTIPERALLEVSSKIEAKLDVMTLRDGEGECVAVSLCEPAVKEMPHLLEEKILQHMTVLHPAEVTISAAIKDLNVSSLETVFDKKEQPELPTTTTNSADIQPSKPEWNVVSTIETITPPEDTADQHEHQIGDLDTTREESFDWRRKRGTQVKKKSQRKKTNDGEEAQHHPPPQETNAASLLQVPSHQDTLIRVETEILSVEPPHTVPTETIAELSHPTLELDTALPTEPDEEASKHSSIGGGLESVDTPPSCQLQTSEPSGTLPERALLEVSSKIEAKLDPMTLRDGEGESVAVSLCEPAVKEMPHLQEEKILQHMTVLHPAEVTISAAIKDLNVSFLETVFDKKEQLELPTTTTNSAAIQPSKPEWNVVSTIETITPPKDNAYPHEHQTGDLDTTREESFDWRRKRGTQVKKKSQRKKTNDGEEAQHHPPPQETNAASLPHVPSYQDALIRVEIEILSVEPTHTVPTVIMAELSHVTLVQDTALSIQTEPDEETSKHSSIGGGLESVDTPPPCQQPTSYPNGTFRDGTQSKVSIIEDRIEAKLDVMSLRDGRGESVAISLLSPAEAIISAAMKDLKVSSLATAFDNKEHPELSINAILPPDIQPSKVEEVLSTTETMQHLITLPEDTVHSQTGDLDTTMKESFDWRRKRGTQVKKKSQRKKTNDGEEAQHHPPPQETNAASLPQVPSHQDTLIRVETGILSVEAPHTVPSEIMAELSHPTLELDTALPTAPDEEASKHSSIGGGLESVDTPPSCQLQTSEPSGTIPERALLEVSSKIEAKLDVMTLRDGEGESVAVSLCEPAVKEMPHLLEEKILQHMTVLHPAEVTTSAAIKDLNVSSLETVFDKKEQPELPTTTTNSADIQPSKPEWNVVSTIETITPPEDNAYPHEHQTGDLDTTMEESFDWSRKRGTQVKKKSQRKKTNDGEEAQHHPPPQETNAASLPQVPSHQDALIRVETEILSVEPTHIVPTVIMAELSHATLVQDTALSIQTEPDEEASKVSSISGGLESVDTPPSCQQPTSDPNGTILDGTQSEVSIIEDRIEAKLDVMSLRDGGGESVAISLLSPAEAIITAAMKDQNVSSLETAFDNKEHPELSINAILPPDIQPSKVEEVLSTIETTQHLITLPEDTVHSQTGDLDTTMEESFDWRRKRGTQVKKKSQRKKTNDGEEAQHHPPPQKTNAASLPQVPSHQDTLIRVETGILSVEPPHTVPTETIAELSHPTLELDTALPTEPDEEASKHSSIGGGLESVDTPPSCQLQTSEPIGTIPERALLEVSSKIEAKLDVMTLRDGEGESVAVSLCEPAVKEMPHLQEEKILQHMTVLHPAEVTISAAIKDLNVSFLETVFDKKEQPELPTTTTNSADIQPSKPEWNVVSTIETITTPEDTADQHEHQVGDLDTTREESFDWRRKRGTQVKKKSQRKKTNDGEEVQHHPPPQETNAASLPQVPSHQDALIRVETGILSVEPPHTVPTETIAELSHPTLELDTALPTEPDEEASKHSSIGGGLESVDTPPPCQLQTSEPSGTIPDRALLEVSSKIEAKLDAMTLRDGEGESVSLCELAVKEMSHLQEEKVQHVTVLHPAEVAISATIKDLNVSFLETVNEQPELPTTTTNSADIQPSKPQWNVVSTIETITPPEDNADPHEHQTGDLDTTMKESFDWRRKRGTQVKKKSQRKKTNDGEEAQHHPPPQETNAASLPQLPSHQDTLIRVETEILSVEPPHTVPTETIAELSHPTLELDTALPTEPDEEASKHSSIGGGLESVDTPPSCQLQTSEPSGTIPDRALLEVSSKIEAKLDVMTLRDGEGESVSLCELAVKEMSHLQEEKIQHVTVLHPVEATISAAIKDLNVKDLNVFSLVTVFDKKENSELPIIITLPPDIQPSNLEGKAISAIETTQQLITPPEDTVDSHEHQTGDLDLANKESFDWRRKRGTQVKKKSQRKKTNDGEEVQHHPPPQETNAASLPQVPSHQDTLIRVETGILSVEAPHTVPTEIIAELSHPTLVLDTALPIPTEPDEEANKRSSISGGLECVDTPPCQQPTSDPNGTIPVRAYPEAYPEVSSVEQNKIEGKSDVMLSTQENEESTVLCGAKDETTAMKEMSCVHLEQGKTLQLERCVHPAEANISADIKDLHISLERVIDKKEVSEVSVTATIPLDIQPSKLEALSTIGTTQPLITLPEATVDSHEHQTRDLDANNEESIGWRHNRGTHVKKGHRRKTNTGKEALVKHHSPLQVVSTSVSLQFISQQTLPLSEAMVDTVDEISVADCVHKHMVYNNSDKHALVNSCGFLVQETDVVKLPAEMTNLEQPNTEDTTFVIPEGEKTINLVKENLPITDTVCSVNLKGFNDYVIGDEQQQHTAESNELLPQAGSTPYIQRGTTTSHLTEAIPPEVIDTTAGKRHIHGSLEGAKCEQRQQEESIVESPSDVVTPKIVGDLISIIEPAKQLNAQQADTVSDGTTEADVVIPSMPQGHKLVHLTYARPKRSARAPSKGLRMSFGEHSNFSSTSTSAQQAADEGGLKGPHFLEPAQEVSPSRCINSSNPDHMVATPTTTTSLVSELHRAFRHPKWSTLVCPIDKYEEQTPVTSRADTDAAGTGSNYPYITLKTDGAVKPITESSITTSTHPTLMPNVLQTSTTPKSTITASGISLTTELHNVFTLPKWRKITGVCAVEPVEHHDSNSHTWPRCRLAANVLSDEIIDRTPSEVPGMEVSIEGNLDIIMAPTDGHKLVHLTHSRPKRSARAPSKGITRLAGVHSKVSTTEERLTSHLVADGNRLTEPHHLELSQDLHKTDAIPVAPIIALHTLPTSLSSELHHMFTLPKWRKLMCPIDVYDEQIPVTSCENATTVEESNIARTTGQVDSNLIPTPTTLVASSETSVAIVTTSSPYSTPVLDAIQTVTSLRTLTNDVHRTLPVPLTTDVVGTSVPPEAHLEVMYDNHTAVCCELEKESLHQQPTSVHSEDSFGRTPSKVPSVEDCVEGKRSNIVPTEGQNEGVVSDGAMIKSACDVADTANDSNKDISPISLANVSLVQSNIGAHVTSLDGSTEVLMCDEGQPEVPIILSVDCESPLDIGAPIHEGVLQIAITSPPNTTEQPQQQTPEEDVDGAGTDPFQWKRKKRIKIGLSMPTNAKDAVFHQHLGQHSSTPLEIAQPDPLVLSAPNDETREPSLQAEGAPEMPTAHNSMTEQVERNASSLGYVTPSDMLHRPHASVDEDAGTTDKSVTATYEEKPRDDRGLLSLTVTSEENIKTAAFSGPQIEIPLPLNELKIMLPSEAMSIALPETMSLGIAEVVPTALIAASPTDQATSPSTVFSELRMVEPTENLDPNNTMKDMAANDTLEALHERNGKQNTNLDTHPATFETSVHVPVIEDAICNPVERDTICSPARDVPSKRDVPPTGDVPPTSSTNAQGDTSGDRMLPHPVEDTKQSAEHEGVDAEEVSGSQHSDEFKWRRGRVVRRKKTVPKEMGDEENELLPQPRPRSAAIERSISPMSELIPRPHSEAFEKNASVQSQPHSAIVGSPNISPCHDRTPQQRPHSGAVEKGGSPCHDPTPQQRPCSGAVEKGGSPCHDPTPQQRPHSGAIEKGGSPCHDPTPQQRPRSGAIEKGGSPCHDPTPQQRPRSGAVEKGGSPCHDPTPQQRPRSGAVEKGGSPCHDPTPQQRPRSGAIEKGGSPCHDPTPQRPRSGAVEKGGSPCHDPTPQQRPRSGAVEKGGSPHHDPILELGPDQTPPPNGDTPVLSGHKTSGTAIAAQIPPGKATEEKTSFLRRKGARRDASEHHK